MPARYSASLISSIISDMSEWVGIPFIPSSSSTPPQQRAWVQSSPLEAPNHPTRKKRKEKKKKKKKKKKRIINK